MQLLQAWSTTCALLIVLIGQQALGATKKGATGATVVLHVGPPKTGTTTIQEELANQASLLQVDGWEYLLTYTKSTVDGTSQIFFRTEFGKGAKTCWNKTAVAANCYYEGDKKTRARDTLWSFFRLDLNSSCLDWLEYIRRLKGTTKKL